MPRRSDVYVTSMGMLYRLSHRQWRFWLRSQADGEDPDLADFGRIVAGNVINVTDMSKEEAQTRLVTENNKKDNRLP